MRIPKVHRERGQDLVEFALILPLLFLLVLGIIELGFLVFAYDTIANAAREGARTAVVPNATEQEACEAVVARALGLDLTYNTANPAACPPSDPYNVCAVIPEGGSTVRVEVIYEHRLLIGVIVQALGGQSTVQIHTVSTMRAE